MRRPGSWCVLYCLAVFAACGPDARQQPGDDDDGNRCTDGMRRCEGTTFEVCQNGAWLVLDECPAFCSLDGCTSCEGPGCASDACMQADTEHSNLGCEYWAVDLDNATEVFGPPIPVAGNECGVYQNTKLITGVKVCTDPNGIMAGRCDDPGDGCPTGFSCGIPAAGVCALDGDRAPFAIVVSNPNGILAAVTISTASGQSMTELVEPETIHAIFPQQLGFADQGLDGTGKTRSAYKITSNVPIVAYQFNPLNDVDVFSNDASLLIPRAGFDTRYIGVSYPTLTRRGPTTSGRDNYNGYLTVVAWEDGTEIQVTPTTTTVAGNDGTPAIQPGQTQTFTLGAFDVLNLEAAAGPDPFMLDGLNGGDLTGTVIQGTNGKSFGVFGGHEAVRISAPASDCCADHLEEMLFPTSTWGKQFAIARTLPRRDAPDMLRIVAAVGGTQVTITPPPAGGSCGVLAANAYCDVTITQATEVTTSQPVTVAHLMMSAIQGMMGTGDPSLAIAPPLEQHRTDYKFLAPMDYDEQYASIVGVQGDTILLDGIAIGATTPFGAGRMMATVPLGVGSHTVSCPLKCSVEVYGWSQAVSYMFAGGLDLHPIVLQ